MPSPAQPIGDDADAGIEQEHPQHPGDRRRDRIGQQQHGLVERRAAHDAVGHHRQQQPRRQRQQRHRDTEERGHRERGRVVGIGEQRGEIVPARQSAWRGRTRRRPAPTARSPAPPARRRRPPSPRAAAAAAPREQPAGKTTRRSTLTLPRSPGPPLPQAGEGQSARGNPSPALRERVLRRVGAGEGCPHRPTACSSGIGAAARCRG